MSASGAILYRKFTTRAFATGIPTTLSGTPVVSVYKDNSTTQSVAGVTLTVDFDGVTGLNHVAIDTGADGTFYANNSHFELVITTGTVGGTSVVGEVVGDFDLAATASSAPTAAAVATAVWQDTTAGDFTVSGSVGKGLFTSGAAPGASGGLLKIGTSPLPATGTIMAAVWDEINTGATHNVTNSTGKQLRTITANTDVIYTGTAPSQAGMTTTQIKLDSGASAVDNVYQWTVLSIISGTGAGESRIATAYVGATKVLTVDSAWTVQPDATSVFEITPTARVQVVSYIAGQDPATLVLDVAAASHNTAATIGAKINLIAAAPTAAAIATAILTDTGDNTTAGSPGKILAQLGAAFTTTSSSVFTTAALANAPTGGGGTVTANITSINGTTFTGPNLPVVLADGVAHGGPPGSSTATYAGARFRVSNPAGDAVVFESTGSSGIGFTAKGNQGGAGFHCEGGSDGSGFNVGHGIECFGAYGLYASSYTNLAGAGICASGALDNPSFLISASDTAPGLKIMGGSTTGDAVDLSTTAGHGISIVAAGTGKHGIVSTGGSDGDGFHGVGAGTGVGFRSAPDAVGFGSGGTADVNVVSLSVEALAQFFTVDTGERYAAPYSDAVAGSVVGEIVSNAGIDEARLLTDIDAQLSGTHGAGAWGGSGGGGLDAAGIRNAIGLATNNLDVQLAAIKSEEDSIVTTLTTVAGNVTTILTQTSGGLDAAGIRAAIGMAAANLDGQLTGLDAHILSRLAASAYVVPLDAIGIRNAIGLATNNLDVQLGNLPSAAQNADKLLGRNIEGGSDSGRVVREALYFLRNKWTIIGGTLTVYAANDSSVAWTGGVSQANVTPVTGIDPA